MKRILRSCIGATIALMFLLGSVSTASAGDTHDEHGAFHGKCAAVVVDAYTGETIFTMVSDKEISVEAMMKLTLDEAMRVITGNQNQEVTPLATFCCVPNPPKLRLYIDTHVLINNTQCRLLRKVVVICKNCAAVLTEGATVDLGVHARGSKEYQCYN